MARSLTVSYLISRAQKRAEMEDDDLLSDAEWKENLSEIYGEFYEAAVATGARYFESEDTITTDGSKDDPLPADFLESIGVDYEVSASTGERRALIRINAHQRNYYSGVTTTSEATHYDIIDTQVVLYPTPPSGQTYYHIYVPQPTELSTAQDADPVDCISPAGEKFIIWGLAALALFKEDSDLLVAAERNRDKYLAKFEEQAHERARHTSRRRYIDDSEAVQYREGDWRWR